MTAPIGCEWRGLMKVAGKANTWQLHETDTGKRLLTVVFGTKPAQARSLAWLEATLYGAPPKPRKARSKR